VNITVLVEDTTFLPIHFPITPDCNAFSDMIGIGINHTNSQPERPATHETWIMVGNRIDRQMCLYVIMSLSETASCQKLPFLPAFSESLKGRASSKVLGTTKKVTMHHDGGA
jgi:hypothetical protein